MLINSSVYAARRARLMEAMGESSVAIFLSGQEKVRSRDTEYRFRAHSDVLYLTGFEEPEAVVVLAPGAKEGPLTMFVRPRDRAREIWTGRRAGVEGAQALYGADQAYGLEALAERLPALLAEREVLYFAFGQDAGFDKVLREALEGLRRRRNQAPGAPKVTRDTRDLVPAMRLVKAPEELALMRRSCEIAAEAHVAAMRACRPGVHEYALEAVIEFVFRRHGCDAPSYGTIVGAGANATVLHYTENRDRIEEGALVLIDAGCEYGRYASDITRTFPASGRFTGPQRDLYEAVLEAEEVAIQACLPGASWQDVHLAAVRSLTGSLVTLGLLQGEVDGLIERKAYERFYMHKTGHWLGMDVHDVGDYYAGQAPIALAPGMVLTVEPGLYVQPDDEEAPAAFRGIGIRVEDDVLVTEAGFEVLTGGAPKAVAEVEALVGSGWSASLG
jgi:Xaa-Pro aminopeptidase